MERHISSFFQWHGTRPLQTRKVQHASETIIYQYDLNRLQKEFVSELRTRSLIGLEESLHVICREVPIEIGELKFDQEKQYGLFETGPIRLHLMRFDTLINDFESKIANITGRKTKIQKRNDSSSKWYKNIYSRFKQTINVPTDVIFEVYETKRDLIDLFFPGQFDSLLGGALAKYKH